MHEHDQQKRRNWGERALDEGAGFAAALREAYIPDADDLIIDKQTPQFSLDTSKRGGRKTKFVNQAENINATNKQLSSAQLEVT